MSSRSFPMLLGMALTVFPVVLFAVLDTQLRADTWQFPKELTTDEYAFGDVKIIRSRDARRDDQYPDWAIHIYRAGELRALYRGVSFEVLAASDDNRVFVGISNRGLPDTAIILFDSDGNLRAIRRHTPAKFDYCQESITIVREWYDAAQPDIRFEYDEKGEFRTISVRSCRGERLDLVPILLE